MKTKCYRRSKPKFQFQQQTYNSNHKKIYKCTKKNTVQKQDPQYAELNISLKIISSNTFQKLKKKRKFNL